MIKNLVAQATSLSVSNINIHISNLSPSSIKLSKNKACLYSLVITCFLYKRFFIFLFYVQYRPIGPMILPLCIGGIKCVSLLDDKRTAKLIDTDPYNTTLTRRCYLICPPYTTLPHKQVGSTHVGPTYL